MKIPKRVRNHEVSGVWLAEVGGRWLDVLHHTCRTGPTLHHVQIRTQDLGTKRLRDLEAALSEQDLVVVQRDRDPVTLARDGYIGVFRFADLEFDRTKDFSLRFTEKYAEAKP